MQFIFLSSATLFCLYTAQSKVTADSYPGNSLTVSESKKKMAKVITQETFNEVVTENVEEFEMTEEEAVADAIKQFEAQVRCLVSTPTTHHSAHELTYHLLILLLILGCEPHQYN